MHGVHSHHEGDFVGQFASAGSVGLGILMALLFCVMPWLAVVLWARQQAIDGPTQRQERAAGRMQ